MVAIQWRKASLYVLAGGLALSVAVLPFVAQAQQTPSQSGQESVADAARKTQQQKKQEPKPKKVFTNDDVTSLPPNATTSAEAKPEAEKKPADAAAGEKKEEKNDEGAWKGRFADAYRKLADAEKELDILQRESSKSEVQFYNDPQKALIQQYSRKDINDKDAQIEAKKKEIADMKQHISDMEDQLRKEGGDPGWARP